MNDELLCQYKLEIALRRGYFRAMDLFSGCGGLTLGFQRAGFKCVSAIEKNHHARASHTANFANITSLNEYCAYDDITKVTPRDAVQHMIGEFARTEELIDVIMGGPPCQAFSRLGRAALWRLEGYDQAHIDDERASLFQHFLEYIAYLKPIAFVLENVPEIGRFGKVNVAEEIAVTADELGYETRYALLNAVWYGVPQLRERMIIIGISKNLNLIPEFPIITHQYNIPSGYATSRSSIGDIVVLEPYDHYVSYGSYALNLTNAITTCQAFADLPLITSHLAEDSKARKKNIDIAFPYTNNKNHFTDEMRNWPLFSSNGHFTGNLIRKTPRDYEIFRRMPENAMYPEAVRISEEIFAERLLSYEQEYGINLSEKDPEWHHIRKATVPPYKVNRYPNKFRKMAANEPARTVPAHLGKDTYSHIHFDSEQARAISVREAARLQSFPDAFKFIGSMNDQFTQIGNAVPPLMAYAIASTLHSQLKAALERH